ncbi:MAG: thiamine pyrophosphate-binding protein [Deltaproteobacteria bacterium]
MKLSDFVIDFLAEKGIRHAFVVTGGASVHLIDSVAKNPIMAYICPQHEQAGAMMADGYARVTGNMALAISTSGPGATNMLTGICGAYYDSIPVLCLTGQVSTFRLKKDMGIRQLGSQETDVVDIFRPVVKYAVRIEDASQIQFELEKACHIATSGRPGPVLIDLPDNLQRADIAIGELSTYSAAPKQEWPDRDLDHRIDQCIELIKNSQRPVLILGWGIRLSKAESEICALIDKLRVPVLPTWAMRDFLPHDHPLLAGSFGTHGSRYGNFTVQNADLVISIGSRLDTRMTGSPLTSFAREAKKVIVDIDRNELDRFAKLDVTVDLLIHVDAGIFARSFNGKIAEPLEINIQRWQDKISDWKEKYPICSSANYREKEVNPYVFIKHLSNALNEGDVIFSDTGCSIAWLMQSFEAKQGQRLFHDFNNTAMGYALPASIGASIALSKKQIICITGDGSLQMNIQELATVIYHQLPIKIFLFNNRGYSMIRQTQEQWLDCRYEATSSETGLAFPDFLKIAKAYHFKTMNVRKNNSAPAKIREALRYPGPVFCNIEINPNHRVVPQVIFGRAIEDPEPFLERSEFLSNMLVKPDDASL